MVHPVSRNELRASVIERFSRIATVPDQERTFPVGGESAQRLGYGLAELDRFPASLTDSFCGVGNPFLLGDAKPGQVVLDLGCGAGFDTLLAAQHVGREGRALGIDMAPEMVKKARRNGISLGVPNVAFLRGEVERLPLGDRRIDLVISNGAFNLCPDKAVVLSEAFRVLRPGGRLQMADILLHGDVTPAEVAQKGEWSD